MKLNEIKTPVTAVTGVGPQLSKALSRLNIFTVGDLLQFYPKDYDDRTKKCYIKDFANHSKINTVAKVVGHEWFGYGRMKTLKIIVNDGTGTAALVCFNRSFLEKSLVPGTIINITGQFFSKYNTIQSSAFDVSIHPFNGDPSTLTRNQLMELMPSDSSVIPVYKLTEGVTQKTLRKIMKAALSQYGHGVEDELPEELIKKHNLVSKQAALSMIHMPEVLEEALSARRTLSYEELYRFQYAILQRAYKRRGNLPSDIPGFDGNSSESKKNTNETQLSPAKFREALSPLQRNLLDKIPFELTPDQKKVIIEMDNEIDQGYLERNKILVEKDDNPEENQNVTVHTMNRLLQGDVGAGKTLVAIFVCLRAISWKGQCAFLAPTEILARQHADKIARMLDSLGVRTAFLTGTISSTGRNQLLKALKDGDIDIVIGTHALFSAQVAYNDLQLAVIDEQHRFGVTQRQAILAKGRTSNKGTVFEPHLLMMSATPIPQSLALTMYSDLDISVIKSLPEGRKPIQTYLVKEGNEQNAYDAVRKELEKGHQAYFVYPAIEAEYDFFDEDHASMAEGKQEVFSDREASGPKLKSAQRNFENLANRIFPDFNCALVHGKIDEDEQSRILNDFHDGKIQVLAATTVIEVGVDVPNATCMVIEQADRFGMAQLHQLRGRVGRGSEQSYCFMIYSKNITESGIERMKALRQSTDGFVIAEQDLKTRGPGEMNGTLQAGTLEFSIADITRDKNILTAARQDAVWAIKNHR